MNDCYLVSVTEVNNNKYYKMHDRGDGRFDVEYGRIGSTCTKMEYPISKWNSKYNEKLRRGYKDVTELHLGELVATQPGTKDKITYAPIPDKQIAELVKHLMALARRTVSQNYKVSSEAVTQAMVDAAQSIIDKLVPMSCGKSVDNFNQQLLELFSVIPRRMSHVNDFLANEAKDFSRIVSAEQNLLDVMRGQVQNQPPQLACDDSISADSRTILEAMGLELKAVTAKDIQLIKKELGECSGLYSRAWKVVNKRTQKMFDEFLDKNGKRLKTLYLWHGSRNENWWSIINAGLLLRPANAIINGKMFGYGIYFANKARKSVGYSSLRGSIWANGDSDLAFLALYKVIYGRPHDVSQWSPTYSTMTYDKLKQLDPGAGCVHAHGGVSLRNDEIIVYQEEQLTISYFVELKV